MTKSFNLMLVSVLLLSASRTNGQHKMEYGSNNGKYLTILTTRIYYEEYGKGTPLILLQGGMGSIGDFAKCIPELSKHYRVIAPDSPGQGRSELADSMSYQLLTEYFSKMIDILKLDSAYVMGWSDGGIVGLLLAEKRADKVKKVLAAGANYTLSGMVPPGVDIKAVKPQPLEEWGANNKEWIANYNKLLPRDWRKIRNDVDKMWFQEEYFPKSVFDRINIPVMILQGEKDGIRLEHALEMHRLIRNSQFCVLPNTSHAVFDEKPDLMNRIAMDFFLK